MVFKEIDIKDQLSRLSQANKNAGDALLSEAKRLLNQELFTGKNVLENLKLYNLAVAFVDEEDLDADLIFSSNEIKKICVLYRLKFLSSTHYKTTLPYEALLKLEHLNDKYGKELKDFKILAPGESFAKPDNKHSALLFVKTNHENYYLVHEWGPKLKWYRKLRFWPMRHFENLFVTIILVTFIITMSLPINLITLDPSADYWSGYRAAAFFHLLIFNVGVVVYTTFAFSKNFSSTIWNRDLDFD